MAQDLNRAKGETVVIIPSRGFSEYDREGGVFYDPDGREAFTETLKRHLRPQAKLIDLDAHINDPQFATKAAEVMDTIIPRNAM
jgi:uncharacterized protein (UPF0261 family)